MKKYLVIAHYDGDRTPLKNYIAGLAQKEPSTFHLIVPATPPPSHGWTWSEEEAYQVAKRRLDEGLRDLQSAGVNATGQVLAYTSTDAVEEALKSDSYDQLIVSTPPDDIAATKFSEFEHRVRLISEIPIEQVIAPDAKPVEQG